MKEKLFEIYSFPGNHEGSVYRGDGTYHLQMGDLAYKSDLLECLTVHYLIGKASGNGKQYYLMPVE
jgi:hypothetical protein